VTCTWTQKLSAYHGLMDVNNDGVVSVEDLRELTKRFSKVNDMTEEQSSMFSGVIEVRGYNIQTTIRLLYECIVEQQTTNHEHVLFVIRFRTYGTNIGDALTRSTTLR